MNDGLPSDLESLDTLETQQSISSSDRNHGPRSLHHENTARYLNEEQQNEAQIGTSRISSNRSKVSRASRKASRISISKRRGLLLQLSLIPEYEDARDYPRKIKFAIVLVIAFAAVTGPMGTSIMLPAIDDICIDLNTTQAIVNVSVGIYLLSLGIFPMWWSSFSEIYGRRNVYLISFSMFLAFSIGASLSPSIGALIIFRVLQGGCSASVQAVGAGTVSDLFIPEEMGFSMGIYYLGPLVGPFAAPILGGVVGEVWGWRATQWVLVIVSGISVMTIMFLLPETLRKSDNIGAISKMLQEKMKSENELDISQEMEEIERTVSQPSIRLTSEYPMIDPVMPSLTRLTTERSQYSKKIVDETLKRELSQYSNRASNDEEGANKWKRFGSTLYDLIIRPTHAVVLLTYPPVAWTITYSATTFAVVYFFNMTISYAYAKEPYNFSSIIIGLMYIPNSVTYIIASVFGGRWNDRLLNNYAKKHNGNLVPEARISWNVVTAVALFPAACLIFGWSIRYGEHWVVPLVGTAIFGFASMLIIGATVTFIVQSLPGKGATGVALNNLIRQILAATATFVVEPLLNAIGPGILFSILMGILLVASVSLYIVKKRSPYWRKHSDLSKLYMKL
ncbi:uncharacterized protein PRCAT00001888001 [Priceomyces carsonii]|uniref:uncharacterized protein n=1 Tax=Priceomyces carsonii TaxID=28549 RepID=UPI002ED7E0D4|nr:unnamed protein product [Priceomyces carsonii]